MTEKYPDCGAPLLKIELLGKIERDLLEPSQDVRIEFIKGVSSLTHIFRYHFISNKKDDYTVIPSCIFRNVSEERLDSLFQNFNGVKFKMKRLPTLMRFIFPSNPEKEYPEIGLLAHFIEKK